MVHKAKERSEQIADAYEAIARANHYMVGLIEAVTFDETETARQILIRRQNALSNNKTRRYRVLNLALDLVEQEVYWSTKS